MITFNILTSKIFVTNDMQYMNLSKDGGSQLSIDFTNNLQKV